MFHQLLRIQPKLENVNWECEDCGNTNSTHRRTCNHCFAPQMNPVFGTATNTHLHTTSYQPPEAADIAYVPTTPYHLMPVDQLARCFVSAFANEADPFESAISYLILMRQYTLALTVATPTRTQLASIPAAAAAPVPVAYSVSVPRRSRPPEEGVNGNWKCSNKACGNVNYPRRTVCNMCKAPRDFSTIPSASSTSSSSRDSSLFNTPTAALADSSSSSDSPSLSISLKEDDAHIGSQESSSTVQTSPAVAS